ncbi:hypothetical protein, partial [Bradyrhizobium retamae]|uniref:hypothetical protein n=1 Tax=Bradyrhizobium retamae TaxID=1300035 RepID=UPI001AECD746
GHRKTCPSSNGSVSKRQNRYDEPLAARFDAILVFVHWTTRGAISGKSRSPANTRFLKLSLLSWTNSHAER